MSNVFDNCKVCGAVLQVGPRTTVKKYCSKECRGRYWDDLRRHPNWTWGEWCDERYGKIPALVLSQAELGWLAGVIDGEGCISIHKVKRSANSTGVQYRLRVEMANTHKGFVERFAALTNATISPQPKRMLGHKDVWKASIGHRKVRRLLAAVLPYLVIKKQQAEIGLRFLELMYNAPRSAAGLHPQMEQMHKHMKALNKRGASVIQAGPITATEVAG